MLSAKTGNLGYTGSDVWDIGLGSDNHGRLHWQGEGGDSPVVFRMMN